MPRLYLVVFGILTSCGLYGQVKLKDLIAFGDEQFQKGDYYYATRIYHQAIEMDSTSVDLHWKQAETQRAYKNYTEAAKWYAKVYAEDPDKIYPNALVYYALMVKQTGDYTKALALIKKAYKEAGLYPSEYAYIKSKQEIKSIEYAIKSGDPLNISVFSMPDSINSYDAEFGHQFRNGKFYFSSLKADSISTSEEVYTKYYRTRNYTSLFDTSGVFMGPQQWESLATPNKSTGNGSFDFHGNYYYSICDDKGYNYKCKIARWVTNDGISAIDTLPSIINASGYNTTNPCWVKLANGKTCLFFSSDREGGKGGMDLWYSSIKKNGDFEEPKNIQSLNSIENEITPWFDQDSSRLYFSSQWHYGFGGYDVYMSTLNDKFQFSKPSNVGQPINSPANDLYYFRQADSIFVSSNRLGSRSKKNPTCCSDIFYAKIPHPILIPAPPDSIPPDSLAVIFPVSLYFRNDYPNPKSYSKKSNVPYHVLYSDYFNARKGYLDSVLDKAGLLKFFNDDVDRGYKVLLRLYDSVRNEMDRGNSVQLFTRGYASPLNVTQYNVNLTQRRISSVQKFFLEYQDQEIKKILDKNRNVTFEIIEVPLGEFAANQSTSDNLMDKAASVYSVAASIERKVEILYMTRTQNKNLQRVDAQPLVQEDEIKEGASVTKRISLSHDVSELVLSEVKFSQEGLKYELKTLNDYESEMVFNFTPVFTGKHALCYADIYFEGIEEPVRVYFTLLKK